MWDLVVEHRFGYLYSGKNPSMVAVPRDSPTPSADVLAGVVAARREAERAERRVLRLVVDYAAAHAVPGLAEPGPGGHEQVVELAGAGAPGVAEFAIADLAAALGLSARAARLLVGQALELAHRLPRIWAQLCQEPTETARVSGVGVPAWRARMVAERTVLLSAAAAAYVDAQVAPIIGRVGPVRLMRIVEAARLLAHEAAQEQLAGQAACHQVEIDTGSAAHLGTAFMDAHLDVADGLDLERAVQVGAANLKAEGSTDPLPVRRAQALGLIARHYLATYDGAGCARGGVQLFVHYRPGSDAAALGVASLDNTDGLVTTDQIATWCGRQGAAVKVTPVIDLAEDVTSGGYVPSPYLRTQVELRDKTCVFPHCTGKAAAADLDHTVAYQAGGPPGQTSSKNLGALCRFHHRVKTHGEWSYEHLAPGWYHWRAPDGRHYLRGPAGSIALE